MTVNNIVNMAVLNGLDIIALTDHNSSKNCPAFMEAALSAGICAIAGMEINTSEEVHAVCLFPSLSDAMAFDAMVYDSLPPISNRPDIFGDQIVLDSKDNPIGKVDKLLINACGISLFDLNDIVKKHNGIYFPAHADKESFSIISNLGFIPEDLNMDGIEIKSMDNYHKILRLNPCIKDLPVLTNSDAHYLWDISESGNFLDKRIEKLLTKLLNAER